MDKDIVKVIRKLNTQSCKYIEVNHKYKCIFTAPENFDFANNVYYFFSESYPEQNSPRMMQEADVFVFESSTEKNYIGKLILAYDKDLDQYSLTLYTRLKTDENWTNMIPCIDFEILDYTDCLNTTLKRIIS